MISRNPSKLVQEPARDMARWGDVVRDMSRQRKLASISIALMLEGLLVVLLLTLGVDLAGETNGPEKITTLKAVEFAAPAEPQPEPEQATDSSPADTPQAVQPVPRSAIRPSPLVLNPQPAPESPHAEPAPPEPQPSPSPAPAPRPKIGARINPDRGYGPVDTGNPRTAGDSEQVGTMPGGEPLFAARWYREPTDSELAGYLSTASGPGYALIACRTVTGYYVEDCQLLSEGPQGAQIGRAVMAAAWQFRVRPARIGGREQFGSWVRIRIDYSVRRAPR